MVAINIIADFLAIFFALSATIKPPVHAHLCVAKIYINSICNLTII